MKNTILFLCSLFILILFANCSKENANAIRVSGTVINKITGKGIAGANVFLLHGVVPVILLSNAEYETVAQTKTNANGYYELSTKAASKGFYKVGATDSNYYSPLSYKSDTALVKGRSNIKNYNFPSFKVAGVRLRVLRHDKAWMAVTVSVCCEYGFSRELYNKLTPIQDLDSMLFAKYPAGITYAIIATLYDRVLQPNGFYDYKIAASYNNRFYLGGIADTTFSEITVQ